MRFKKFKHYYLPALTVFLILWCWLPRLFKSLWLDEALTFWAIDGGGLAGVFQRVIDYHGQTPLSYLFPWLTINISHSEFLLRLPAFCFSLLSCFFVYQIGRCLFSKKVGQAAALIFVSLDGVIFSAVSARPYSLALLGVLTSTYFLLKMTDAKTIRYSVGYIMSLLVASYAHYFYGGIALIHLFYVIRHRENRVLLKRWPIAALVVLAALIPCIPQLADIASRKTDLSITGQVAPFQLLMLIVPVGTLSLLLVSLLFASGVTGDWIQYKRCKEYLFRHKNGWVVGWYFLPPVLFFLLAFVLQSPSLFEDRYVFWYSPALALLLALVVTSFISEKARVITLVGYFLLVVASEPYRPIFTENWRGATSFLNARLKSGKEKFLFHSGLIESRSTDWLRDSKQKSYLTAPLAFYSVKGEPLVVPYDLFGAEAQKYWDEEIVPSVGKQERVYALGSDIIEVNGVPMSEQLSQVLAQNDFELKEEQFFKKNWVKRFERKTP